MDLFQQRIGTFVRQIGNDKATAVGIVADVLHLHTLAEEPGIYLHILHDSYYETKTGKKKYYQWTAIWNESYFEECEAPEKSVAERLIAAAIKQKLRNDAKT